MAVSLFTRTYIDEMIQLTIWNFVPSSIKWPHIMVTYLATLVRETLPHRIGLEICKRITLRFFNNIKTTNHTCTHCCFSNLLSGEPTIHGHIVALQNSCAVDLPFMHTFSVSKLLCDGLTLTHKFFISKLLWGGPTTHAYFLGTEAESFEQKLLFEVRLKCLGDEHSADGRGLVMTRAWRSPLRCY